MHTMMPKTYFDSFRFRDGKATGMANDDTAHQISGTQSNYRGASIAIAERTIRAYRPRATIKYIPNRTNLFIFPFFLDSCDKLKIDRMVRDRGQGANLCVNLSEPRVHNGRTTANECRNTRDRGPYKF